MELATALDYARTHPNAVLVTLKADGRPQSSHVRQWTDGDGVVRVSLTDTRAKTRNLRRDPRVSVHVLADDFWSYAVLEGLAELSPCYRAMSGEHPDWDDYRRAMVADHRLVLRVRPTYAYGMVP